MSGDPLAPGASLSVGAAHAGARLRLLIADDHTVLRESLRRAIEAAGHEVVAEAADGEQAVAAAERTRPDCAVLDVAMPKLDGIAAARRIAALHIPVVGLTMHGDEATHELGRNAGMATVLTKDCSVGDLLTTIQGVVAPGAVEAPPPPLRRWRDPTTLSNREAEVLRLLAAGHSTIEVSEALVISTITVKNHLASIYRKLGCHGRTAAVVYALKHGLVDDHRAPSADPTFAVS